MAAGTTAPGAADATEEVAGGLSSGERHGSGRRRRRLGHLLGGQRRFAGVRGAEAGAAGQSLSAAKAPFAWKACSAKRSPMRRWAAVSGWRASGSGSSAKSASP